MPSGNPSFSIASQPSLEAKFPTAARLPNSLKILLENLLRTEDGEIVTAEDIKALVDPSRGRLVWMLDRAAAAMIERKS